MRPYAPNSRFARSVADAGNVSHRKPRGYARQYDSTFAGKLRGPARREARQAIEKDLAEYEQERELQARAEAYALALDVAREAARREQEREDEDRKIKLICTCKCGCFKLYAAA